MVFAENNAQSEEVIMDYLSDTRWRYCIHLVDIVNLLPQCFDL